MRWRAYRNENTIFQPKTHYGTRFIPIISHNRYLYFSLFSTKVVFQAGLSMRQGVFPSWGKLCARRDAVPRVRTSGVVGWHRQDAWNKLRKAQCSRLDHDMGNDILFCTRPGKMKGRSSRQMEKAANFPYRKIFFKKSEKRGKKRPFPCPYI